MNLSIRLIASPSSFASVSENLFTLASSFSQSHFLLPASPVTPATEVLRPVEFCALVLPSEVGV